MHHVSVIKYYGYHVLMINVIRPQQAPVGCDLPSVQFQVCRHKQRRRHRQALGRKNRWDMSYHHYHYLSEIQIESNCMHLTLNAGDFIRDLVALESGGSGGVVWRIRSSPTKLVRFVSLTSSSSSFQPSLMFLTDLCLL